jgi:hypothetical protein
MTADPLQPLIDALRRALPQVEMASLSQAADHLLRGQSATVGDSTASLTFGQGNDFRNATVTIGSVVGRDNITLNITFPQPINPQAASLQHLLYHHESATIFANRLDTFVGREAEIAEIRQHIAQIMPTGGYVTITAQAGEGKSSVIAQMVSQDGPDQTAFHFIALTPGREYQLSLLRPIVARLILKHGLPTTDFPGESYHTMRDYFHVVLRQISERGKQEIIYIDGLDQLEGEAGRPRELNFLPSRPPPGIVFVLGTRPDDTLAHLGVKKLWVIYQLPHLSQADFRHLLRQQRTVTTVAQRVYDVLQGNAFYLALAAQELKSGPIADIEAFIHRISNNPDNLFGLAIERLQHDNTQWKRVMEPVLGLLLVAQEALDRATIRSLLGVSDVVLRRGLDQLGGLVAQDTKECYFLYHLKVREYLAEDRKDANKPYVVSQDQLIDWHQRLAHWCVRDAQDIEHIWEDSTGSEQTRRWYARQHYVTHLAHGHQWATVSHVIDDGTYGRFKRRFDPSTQRYTLDLAQGQDMAFQMDDLIHLWRWSLLRFRLTNQIDAWPDALFSTLVSIGRGNEALARIDLLSDPKRKVMVLLQILPLLDQATAQRGWKLTLGTVATIRYAADRANVLCDLALRMAQARHPDTATTFALAAATASTIMDAKERVYALWNLALRMAQARHPDTAATFALSAAAASAIKDAEDRANTLCTLALWMAQARHPDTAATFALAAAAASVIRDARKRNNARDVVAKAQVKAGLLVEAQATILTIDDEMKRAEALCDLALSMAQTQHPDSGAIFALAAAATNAIRDPWTGRNYAPDNALTVLAKAQANAGLLVEAQATILTINDEMKRAEALCDLALSMAQTQHPDSGAIFDLAAAATNAIKDSWRSRDDARDNARTVLAQAQAKAGFLVKAQSIILTITDTSNSDKALHVLAEAQVKAGLWAEAQATILTINDEMMQIEALCDLAVAMAQAQNPDTAATFALAATTAATTQSRKIRGYPSVRRSSMRNNVLRVLAKAQAKAGLRTTPILMPAHTSDRDQALGMLAEAQAKAGLLIEAQATILTMPHTWARDQALGMLAEAQVKAGRWAEAQATILTMRPYASNRNQALGVLAEAQVKAGLLIEAQATILSTDDHTERGSALCNLALVMSQASQHADASTTFALAVTASTKYTGLFEYLDPLLALMEAHSQARHPLRARVFGFYTRAATWTRASLLKAFRQFTTFTTDWTRDSTLRVLVHAQSKAGLWSMAQATSYAITDADERAMALYLLVGAQAKAKRWAEAQATCSAINDAEERSYVLTALADAQAKFERWAEAHATILTMPHTSDRDQALGMLADAQARAGLLIEAHATILTITASSTRDQALGMLADAQAKSERWAEAQATILTITAISDRDQALGMLADAQAKAGRWAEAQATILTINDDRKRVRALHDFHKAMAQVGYIAAIRRSIATTWRSATTYTELLTLAEIAHPLIAHDPALGRAMVDAFAWVDDQLREG